jgi:KDO2-lipid IV(A) lauroyltransferase
MARFVIKKWKYQAGDFLAACLVGLAMAVFRVLPPGSYVAMAKVLGKGVPFLPGYRKRAIGNLSIAFANEKSQEEIRALAKEVFYHLALTGLETLYGIANPVAYLANIQVEGKEYLDSALAQGNGVVAVGAHLGPFTALGAKLGSEGFKINIIINMRNLPKFWKKINDVQRRFGEQPFPSKPRSLSVRTGLDCLRRNEILYIISDQQQRRGGVAVPFFGRMAFSPPGAAIFSLKTGAPVLPVFVLRQGALNRRLVIGEPIDIERTLDQKKDIVTLTAKITNAIEETVRQHPGQWAWINHRWKQPRQVRPLDRREKPV